MLTRVISSILSYGNGYINIPNFSFLLIDLVKSGFNAWIPSIITIPFYGNNKVFVF